VQLLLKAGANPSARYYTICIFIASVLNLVVATGWLTVELLLFCLCVGQSVISKQVIPAYKNDMQCNLEHM